MAQVLELYRDNYSRELMGTTHARRLVGEGGGGGSLATPHWRDPLVHTGWKNGAKHIKTERLKMTQARG